MRAFLRSSEKWFFDESGEVLERETISLFETTLRYFKDWGALELKGNNGIKERVKSNILRAERIQSTFYKQEAERMKISVGEFKERLQEKVEGLVARSEFFKAIHPHILQSVLEDDGRFKNQFEIGRSDGLLDPTYRAEQEEKMFDFPPYSSGAAMRPIYGYFSDDKHGIINEDGRIPPPNRVCQYGAVTVKLKKERVLERTTVTFHDSLHIADVWPPTPASKPHFTSFNLADFNEFGAGGEVLDTLGRTSVTNWGGLTRKPNTTAS
ncbi:MAG TPA: hypothetical protein VJB99_00060 [Patescibacteria group bacterium]|nr:hypothetical protein [Patescibacteria group bacterium]